MSQSPDRIAIDSSRAGEPEGPRDSTMTTVASAIDANADALLDRWARHVRAGGAGRFRRGLGTRRARANMRPILAAVAAALSDRAALAELAPGRTAYLVAQHFGELRQQQGVRLAEMLDEFRHLRREVAAQILEILAPGDPAAVEALQRMDEAIDRASAIATVTYHQIEVETLTELVSLDPLTGLHDYGYLWDRLEQEIVRSRRHARPVSVVMLDVDAFKTYNDRYGHLWGDAVLKEVAAILQATSRRSDVLARYGGDEFILILPETTLEGAIAIAERTRVGLGAHRFRGNGDDNVALSVSAGCAALSDGEEISAREMVARADSALYEAKRLGRNHVAVFHNGLPCLVP